MYSSLRTIEKRACMLALRSAADELQFQGLVNKSTLLLVVASACALLAVMFLAIGMHTSWERAEVSSYEAHELQHAREITVRLHDYFADIARHLRLLCSLQLLRLGGTTEIQAVVDDFQRQLDVSHVTGISCLDADATVVVSSTSAEPMGLNHRSSDFSRWAMGHPPEGSVFVSDLLAGDKMPRSPQRASLLLASCVTGPREPPSTTSPVAFVTFTIDLGPVLAERAADVGMADPRSGLWVIDRSGTLLSHSTHPSMVLRNLNRQDASCAQCHASFEHVKEMLARGEGTTEYALKNGPTKLAAFAAMNFANASWTVVVDSPYEQVTAFIGRIHREVYILIALTAIGLTLAGVLIQRIHVSKVRAEQEARHWREKSALEDRIKQSEARYRTLFEESPDAILIIDPETERAVEFNDQACLPLGYTRDEFAALRISDYDPTEDDASTRKHIERILRDRVDDFETKHRTKQGKIQDAHVTVRVIEIDGRPFLHNVRRDITDRKRLEEQFRQAQKLEAVGRLAGGVAHDFNNLLTAILGYSNMLMDRLGEDHPAAGDVEQIVKAGERAAGLTRQLLAFSRKQAFAPEVLNLNLVVSNLQKMIRRLIGEDVELDVRLASTLRPVKADPGQIEQVIMNLCVNARDAMPHGGTLTIETRQIDVGDDPPEGCPALRPGSYVRLAVKDTGVGMDATTKSHLFEPFFTTKESGKGTGLGLATVYGIIDRCGGCICVRSEPGEGAAFEIYLPPAAESVVPAGISQTGDRSALRGTERILLVEDDDAVRDIARKCLEARGYTVLPASTARMALDLTARTDGPFHLLVTDIVMPGMTGVELAALIRVRIPGIKVLYMSGYTDESILHAAISEPGVTYLQKPFAADAFVQKVRTILDGS